MNVDVTGWKSFPPPIKISNGYMLEKEGKKEKYDSSAGAG